MWEAGEGGWRYPRPPERLRRFGKAMRKSLSRSWPSPAPHASWERTCHSVSAICSHGGGTVPGKRDLRACAEVDVRAQRWDPRSVSLLAVRGLLSGGGSSKRLPSLTYDPPGNLVKMKAANRQIWGGGSHDRLSPQGGWSQIGA